MEPSSPEIQSKNLPEVTIESEKKGNNLLEKFVVKDVSGSEIGELTLMFYPRRKEMEIGWVSVADEKKGVGFGQAIYSKAAGLSAPDGEHYKLVSSGQMSDEAIKTWGRLVERGLAVKTESGRFEMLDASGNN